MKYPVILVVAATILLLVGTGIRVHANSKYMDKMYYHTIAAGLYKFEDVFAERKVGNTLQVLSVIAGAAGALWFTAVAIRREKRKSEAEN
jgi:hypothetical protein